MSQRRTLPPSNAAIEALCCAGPLLDSFDIELSTVRSTPAGRTALAFLNEVAGSSDDASCLSPELMALARAVREELLELDMGDLARWLGGLDVAPPRADAAEHFWDVFAPDSAGLLGSWEIQVAHVREQRLVTIDPIKHSRPDGHILFTSNVLLTSQTASDEHRWHFDHPMTIGADVTSNEIVHGLRGLNAAIAFEKDRGTLNISAMVD